MRIRVLLADDHKLFREGLRSLLEKQSEILVAAEASSGREAVTKVEETNPDVIVMDIAMPDMNGIEATREIKASHPKSKILCLSMHSNASYVASMLHAGASGYVLKDCPSSELLRAIQSVASDKTYLSPEVAGGVVRQYVHKLAETDNSAAARLTPREREVFQLLVEGHAVKQIAQQLSLSVKTVHTHRERIMSKLNVKSTAELTKHAMREGLISP